MMKEEKTPKASRKRIMSIKQPKLAKSETFNFDIGKRPTLFKHLEKEEIRNKKRVIIKAESGQGLPKFLTSPISDRQNPRLLPSFGTPQQSRTELTFRSPVSNRNNPIGSDVSFTQDYDETIASIQQKLEKMEHNHS